MKIFAMTDKIRRLLSPRDKVKLLFITLLMTLAALLEMVGIGLLVGVVSLFLKPGVMADNGFYRDALHMCGGTREGLLIAALGVLGIFFIFKSLFTILVLYLQASFISAKQKELSVRLFSSYLYAPYGYMSKFSAADLNNNISRVTQLCYNVLIPLMQMLADALVIVLLSAVMLWAMPWITLGSVTFMLLGAGGCYWLTRRWNSQAGRRMLESDTLAVRVRQAGLWGLKYIKSAVREKYFAERYGKNEQEVCRNFVYMYTLGQLPRVSLELLAFLLLLGIFALMLYMKRSSDEILLTFTMIVAVMSRLLPSLSRSNYNLTIVRQSQFLFDELFKEFMDIPREDQAEMGGRIELSDRIEFRDVTFGYGGGEKLFDRFNYTIKLNESVGVVGTTGCGKTTLSDLLMGLLKPDKGEILVDGRNIAESLASWRRQIGYVPQTIHLLEGTIRENVAFGLGEDEVDENRVWEALELAQMRDTVRGVPEGLDYVLTDNGNNLSGGQRQRLGIARALYSRPAVLILDEATSALDNATEGAFVEALEELHGKLTMLVIAHRTTTIERCDRVLELTKNLKS